MATMRHTRDSGGRLVRQIWIKFQIQHNPNPKPAHIAPWEEMNEDDKEVDRQIWEEIVSPYNKVIGDLITRLDQVQKERDEYRDRLFEIEIRQAED